MRNIARLSSLATLVTLLAFGCGDSSAGDAGRTESESEGASGDGDGDGHTSSNDHTTGDGDPTTGDGDPTTTGDGDPTTSGDGDPTTTGDGDPTTTGDGDPTTTGDGDPTTGDGDPTTGDGDPTTGDGDPTTGDGDPTTGDGDPTTGDGDPTTGDGDGDPVFECVVTECSGKVYQCGDCIDNDGDGFIDSNDANCWGPCDNNEAGFKGNIPGQGQSPCTSLDCYFDADSGSGNDQCYWNHSCDPSSPNPSGCNYNPNANLPGSGGMTCESAQQEQSPTCEEVCGPLVPNGCDCFGCCDVHVGDQSYTVYLGTQQGMTGTCSVENVADPTLCAPCIQVAACLNPCEECEICIGQVEVPDGCNEAACPDGVTSCDPANNNADCPPGDFCLTGCCAPAF